MDEYAALFQFLNLPDAALETTLGTLHFPNTDAEFFNFGVFLPAMLPLWSTGGPSYVGYWKHWFSPRRLTVVQADIEENLLAHEIARDFGQLVCVAVQAALSVEGSLSPEIRDLAARTGLPEQELDQIVQVAEITDEENGLLVLAAFIQDPPLACFPEDGQSYFGDFPHDAMTLTPQIVRNLCTYETSTRLSQQIAALPFAPPGFMESDQSIVFDDLLQQSDYGGAWLSLNSTGWKVADAKASLRRLASQSREPGLDLLAEAWSAQPHEEQGTY
jgi:hypothetical protein